MTKVRIVPHHPMFPAGRLLSLPRSRDLVVLSAMGPVERAVRAGDPGGHRLRDGIGPVKRLARRPTRTHRSVKVMVASGRRTRYKDGIPAECPGCRSSPLTWTWTRRARSACVTWVTRSRIVQTPIGLRRALLSSISSTTPLLSPRWRREVCAVRHHHRDVAAEGGDRRPGFQPRRGRQR